MEQGSELTAKVSSSAENMQLEMNDDVLNLSSVKEVHSCPYKSCSFSTAWKSSLNMHMKTHTDERPWQCALCSKHFKLKHHLKHHILTHSQHKLLKCNLCEYKCNDSHSLQRHKVSRHRFPLKRSIKKNSLPTMVNLPSMEELSGKNAFFNSLLEQGQNLTSDITSSNLESDVSEPLSSATGTVAVPSDGNISSVSQMILQQQSFQTSSPLKLRNIRSVSDSFSPTFAHRISSSENESIVDLSDDLDKSISKHNLVSSAESNTLNVKEEISHGRESPGSSSLQNRPTSLTSYDYLHGNRSSIDLATSKSLTLIEKRFSTSSRDPTHSPVFEDHPKSRLASRSKGSKENAAASEKKDVATWTCCHCGIIFPNNIMYGLHMGCHSVGNPFQCNICGMKCKDSHDFMFHFTIGRHLT